MFSLEEALNSKIVCQKRTGKNKRFVFLDGDRVIKGPYERNKVDRIMYVSKKLREWNSPFIVHPIEEIISGDNNIYLTFPNVSQGYPEQFEKYTETFVSSYSTQPFTMNILKRSGVVKLGDVITDLGWIGNYIPWLTLSLCHLFILGVGDMNLGNILVDIEKKRVYIIDYEDQRSTIRDDEFFYFNKRPSKEKGNFWIKHVLPYSQPISEKLETLNSPEFTDRINKSIELLKNEVPILLHQPCDLNNIGQMVYRGQFGGTTTYSGHKVDEVKSALQKYIRRNKPQKALMSGLELFRMGELKEGRGIQTNLYNRLAVISAEDIGIANLPLVVSVISESLSASDGNERNPYKTGLIIKLLSVSEKTRISSHLYNAYVVNKERAKDEGLLIDEDYDSDVKQYCEILFSGGVPNKDNLLIPSDFWKETDPVGIRGPLEMFSKRLSERDHRAVTWAYFYLNLTKSIKLKTRRRRRSKPDILLWEIIRNYLPDDFIEPIEKAYFKLTEKRPFLMLAISAILYDVVDDEFEKTNIYLDIDYRSNTDEVNTILKPKPDYKLELDSYVYDKHTQKGRLNGADRKQFVDEGAYIEPESQIYHSEILKRIYEMQ